MAADTKMFKSNKNIVCVKCSQSIAGFGNSGLCKSCSHITHGETLKKHYCKCGNEITASCALYGKGTCQVCKNKFRPKMHYNVGENHPQYKNTKSKCKICGKILTHYRGNDCCCRDCLDFSGKNNPNYIEGLDRVYPYKFNEELKELIRKRDHYTCQYCGIKQKDYYRALDIHHIDYIKLNLDKNNLISLCSNCHIKTNGSRDYWYAYYSYIMENRG